MKKIYYLLSVLVLLVVFNGCKNANNTDASLPEKKEKKVLTQKEKKQISSVMTQAMMNQDVKTFVSYLVTDGLTDMLSKEDGPFTILAPSNEAFEKLKEEVKNSIKNPKKKSFLDSVLKTHILKTDLNTVSLTQKIQEGKGMYQTVNLLGETVTFKKSGDDLIVEIKNGSQAKLVKTDIKGGNGFLHILDAVLVPAEAK
jgi:uncharacterized surface protein with fasciclin (FAS1) repeats